MENIYINPPFFPEAIFVSTTFIFSIIQRIVVYIPYLYPCDLCIASWYF